MKTFNKIEKGGTKNKARFKNSTFQFRQIPKVDKQANFVNGKWLFQLKRTKHIWKKMSRQVTKTL